MWASGVVGCESKWEVVNRFGGVEVGGMERRRVVEVPRDRMASPGDDKATTVAGLSPVKGAIKQSVPRYQMDVFRDYEKTHLD